jgi:hypothetical protein
MGKRAALWGWDQFALALVLLFAMSVWAQAENWPRFRGPNGQGISDATTIPVKWSDQDYKWKVALPGGGHSSPVVWDGKVFVTSGDDKTLQGVVLCLAAADGREQWRKQFELDKHPMNALNSYASATPALDADQVYVVWPGPAQARLIALTHEGREVWTVKLPGVKARHGAGSSPIVCGDDVIVSREQDKGNDLKSVWLAVDRKTGQVRWRYEHPQNANGSYSTPCILRDKGGREQLIFSSNSHGIAGVDPQTGSLLWETPAALPARVLLRFTPSIVASSLMSRYPSCTMACCSPSTIRARSPAFAAARARSSGARSPAASSSARPSAWATSSTRLRPKATWWCLSPDPSTSCWR